MYLIRVELDVRKKQTQLGLVSRNKFHGAIEDAYSLHDDKTKRKLWRIDKVGGNTYLLLMSEELPDLSEFVRQFGKESSEYEIKKYDALLDRVANHSVWQFRLVANPTRCVKQSNGRGKRVAHTSPKYQVEWLKKQGEKNGFHLLADNLQIRDVTWLHFNKKAERMIHALAVTYEGLLEVDDADKFREVLTSGLGREKAYGMGLLTIMGR